MKQWWREGHCSVSNDKVSARTFVLFSFLKIKKAISSNPGHGSLFSCSLSTLHFKYNSHELIFAQCFIPLCGFWVCVLIKKINIQPTNTKWYFARNFISLHSALGSQFLRLYNWTMYAMYTPHSLSGTLFSLNIFFSLTLSPPFVCLSKLIWCLCFVFVFAFSFNS